MARHIYEVTGVGVTTNRSRKKRYQANSEDAARKLAIADGTEVHSIVDCGVEPPTEPQINYAKSLGISIPEGVSKQEISVLIDNAVQGVGPAPDNQLELARSLGVAPHRFINSEDLETLIRTSIGPVELAQWYLFLVLTGRGTSKAKRQLQSPSDPFFLEAAEELAKDPQFIQSIQRNPYVLKFDGIELNQSYAYKRAAYILKPYLTASRGKPDRSKDTQGREQNRPGGDRATDDKGLLKSEVSLAQLSFIVIVLGILAYWFLS